MNTAFSIRKARLIWAFASLSTLAAVLLLMGRAHADTLGFSVSSTPAPGSSGNDLSVLVLDDATLQPIEGAIVTGAPSAPRLTAGDGTLLLKDVLTHGSALNLSASKEGFAQVSVLGVRSARITFFLKALAPPTEDSTVIASGVLSRWPDVGAAQGVVAGLVFQSISALDLPSFSKESFLSPLKDKINVLGSHNIPSNLAIPGQDLTIVFAPVHLEKPVYRLPVARGKTVRLAALQGTLSVGDVISLATSGGKVSMDVVNKLNFTHAGIADAVTADADFMADIDASHELRPTHRVTPSAPPFAADVMVAATTDMDGTRGTLMPTDIKLAASAAHSSDVSPVELGSFGDSRDSGAVRARDVLTVALEDKGKRLTGIVTEQAGADVYPGEFMDIDSQADVPALPATIQLPPMPTGLASVVYRAGAVPVAYVYALPGSPGSATTAPLISPSEITSYSIVEMEFGEGFDGRNIDGQTLMTGLRRFARATANVGAR